MSKNKAQLQPLHKARFITISFDMVGYINGKEYTSRKEYTLDLEKDDATYIDDCLTNAFYFPNARVSIGV
jgi:hypothetical protein